ncbi:uncharacterized protein CXQ87_000491 [Candidozyma duobushaemuli]|uniref:XPG-I domain-containing protein n=1 Tax=Candidozyma duobushaemuli TaxID=1231522 RepID=A0A2V1AHT6_9ASCO|nr:uncharacterized protein CXQ87_000491 [[Candida] duobushaemulonis]PVH17600.1 hypothetical protein CXQ87_000491 [[Candida] duobushaemulonis]
MGIDELWPVVSPGSDPRIPFPKFLSHFIEENGRPPRFAIDAYMFMFYSQLPNVDPEDPDVQNRTIRNFMAKLWYFVQHNVSFVVVFDGKFKPSKLRHGNLPEIQGSINYDEVLEHFHKVHPSNYGEGSGLVERMKRILQRNCMDIVQAPGEAEAECAWLQRLGVVDYVISDDSDTLVFGATKMIRQFNRVKYMNDEDKPVLSNTDYYVTPVRMEKITEVTGLDRNRLVLIAILRGGDYSTGAEGIGMTRAKEIALCGTNLLSSLPRKLTQDFGALPDFSAMFSSTFINQEKVKAVSLQPWKNIKSELDRSDSLQSFNKYLDSALREQHKEIFGRQTTMKAEVKIDEYFALLYFFPLVNSKIFKFTPYSTSFGELEAAIDDMPGLTPDDETQTVKRYNYVCDAGDIGHSVVKNGKFVFVGKGRANLLKKNQYALPRERKFNLKSFALKLLLSPKASSEVFLARSKVADGIQIGVLKFQKSKLHEKVYLVQKTRLEEKQEHDEIEGEEQESQDPDNLVQRDDEDDEKLTAVNVTMESIRLIAPSLVDEFEKEQSKKDRLKKSPKKKAPPQKTTLDRLWPGMSPSKKLNNAIEVIDLDADDVVEVKAESLDGSPTKNKSLVKGENGQSPVKKENRSIKKETRRRRKTLKERYELPRNQSDVTAFFSQNKNPFEEQNPLFVPESEDEDSNGSVKKENEFMKMKNTLSNVPFLPGPNMTAKAPVEGHISSPESSPSKKIRMTLSPDNSPVKTKGLPTGKPPTS